MGVRQPANTGAPRYSRLGSRQQQAAKASWEEADPQDLWRTVTAVTNAGDAIMFSRTRDGGAVVLTVLSGDDRVREYATGETEIAELLSLTRASAEEE